MNIKEAADVLRSSEPQIWGYVKAGYIRTLDLPKVYSDKGDRPSVHSKKTILYDSDVYGMAGLKIKKKNQTFVYTRVNILDDSSKEILIKQRGLLTAYAASIGKVVDKEYTDISSGANWSKAKRPGLWAMFMEVFNGDVDTIIVETKDRLSRFGFDLIELMLMSHGCSLIVINKGIKDEYYQNEQAEDITNMLSQASVARLDNTP